MDTSKKRIVEETEDIDNQDDSTSIGEEANLRRTELISQLRLLDSKMESLCRQKARAKWLSMEILIQGTTTLCLGEDVLGMK